MALIRSNPLIINQPSAPRVLSVVETDITDCGLTDGELIISGAGGTGSYEFSIDSGSTWQTNGTFSGLPAGNYNIAIRNDNGSCIVYDASNPYSISAPTAPTYSSVTSTNITDCGLTDGTITIIANTGTGATEYSIDSGSTWQSNGSFTSLSAGDYFIVIRNSNTTCKVYYNSNPIVVTAPIMPIISGVVSTDASDCNINDGTITVTAIGGLGSFQFSNDSGSTWQSSNTFGGLLVGNYNIAVRNSNGTCAIVYVSNPVVISQPTAPTISNVVASDVSNCGVSDGIITITATGGQGSYEYSIDSGSTWQLSNVSMGLAEGDYHIAIRNLNGTCEVYYASNPLTITAPMTPVISNVIYTDITNCGVTDGSITITATGGTGSFEYSIDGGLNWSVNNSFTGLSSGTYSLEIRNDNGTCEVNYVSNPITINAPIAPSISNVFSTEPSDCGINDGVIAISATGGSGGYHYSIDSGSTWQVSSSFTDLGAGNYHVAIRNNDLTCEVYYGSNPISFPVLSFPTIASQTSTNPTDCGVADGTLTITASGGLGSYEFSIDSGSTWQSSGNFTNLSSGTYYPFIRNNNQTCKVAGVTVVILNPTSPILNSVTTQALTNCGTNDGQITIFSTGAGEYSIDSGMTWQVSNNFIGLSSGTYNAFIRNADGTCQVAYSSNPIVLSAPSQPIVTNLTTSNVTDCGVSDGTITITATGGLGSYEYSIDSGSTWQTSNSFTSLTADNYYAAVRNNDGSCANYYSSNPVVISTPSAPIISSVVGTDVSNCGSTDGSITVSASGASGLEYSKDSGTTWQSSNLFSNLDTGTYYIFVRNDNGTCETAYGSNPILIGAPLQPNISNVIATDPTNCGLTDGTITVTATGGIGSYDYSIDNGSSWQSSNSFTGLSGGNYTIKIRNNDGTCDVAYGSTIILTDPVAPTILNVISTNPTDCGTSDGNIYIIATGSGTLEYSIDSGSTWQTNFTFSSLNAGDYNIVVRNNNGSCKVYYTSNPVTLAAPSQPNISTVTSANPTNCNMSDGTITITATSGVSPLQYSVDGGTVWQTNNVFSGLAGGIYTIKVRNATGTCEQTYGSTITLTDPTAPTISNVVSTNATDCSTPDGTITITATNGTGSYEFSIDNGSNWQASNSFTGLSSGNYTVIVRNDNGTCEVTYASNPVVITAPSAPSISSSSSADPTDCGLANGSITLSASGGTGSYEYSIDSGSTWQASGLFTGLSGGVFYPYVRNNNGTCATAGNAININDKVAPTFANVVSINTTDCGTANGTITIVASSATVEYSIDSGTTWQPSNTFTSLAEGNYNLALRNNDGTCVTYYASNPVLIGAPTQPVISTVLSTNPTDCNIADGTITITATSGIAPLQYSIDGGTVWLTTNTFTGLSAGNYTIKVRNATASCAVTHSATVTLINPTTPVISTVIATDETGCNLSDGTITVTATSGTGSYEYSIDNGSNWQTSSSFTGLASGAYNVVVRNDNGTCEVTYASNPLLINAPSAPSIVSSSSSDPTDCTVADGIITLTATGGTGSYQYSIDSGSTWQTSGVFTGLSGDVYYTFVRNDNGTCEVFGSTITLIDKVAASFTNVFSTNVTNCGNSDGTITIFANSGSIEYSIDSGSTWQASNAFTGLTNGNYNLVIRNADGTCKVYYASNPVVINAPLLPLISSVSSTDPNNCGVADGTISITAIGGLAPLQYSIDGGTNWQTSSVFTGLSGGNYSIQVRNNNGTCIVVGGVETLTDKVPPTGIGISSTNVSNCGAADGSITITATTGSSPAEYSINNGGTWQSSNVFTGLSAGSYNIVVRNNDGTCITLYAGNPAIIVAPTQPSISSFISTNPTDCAVSDGVITINATGGLGTYEYSIDSGTTWQSSNTFNGLTGGLYKIAIRNSNGTCVVLGNNISLFNKIPPLISAVNSTGTGCNGNNGTISIVASGGEPLEYSIDNGLNWQASSSFNGLSDGNYNIAVRYLGGTCLITYGSNPVVIINAVAGINVVPDTMTIISDNSSNTTDLCLPIPMVTINQYEIYIDNQQYTGGYTNCSGDASIIIPVGTDQIIVIDTIVGCSDTTVLKFNYAPIAIDDQAITTKNTNTTGNVLTNDLILDDDNAQNVTIITNAQNGSATLQASGDFNYVPNSGFVGLDSFIYSLCDGTSLCDTATVRIQVLEGNTSNTTNSTVATNDIYIGLENSIVIGQVAANDYSILGNNLQPNTNPISAPSNGSVVINSDGIFVYIPNNGFVGVDTFQYQICDDGIPIDCDTAYVFITILPNTNTNNNPVAIDDAFVDLTSGNITGDVTLNDYDPDGNNLTVNTTPITAPSNGTLTLAANGVFTYTPNSGYSGPDVFVYEICDDGTPSKCSQATVNLVSTYVSDNNPPIALPDFYNLTINNPITDSLVLNDYDPDGDNITINTVAIQNPLHGILAIAIDGSFTYTPTSGFVGTDTALYEICDNGSPSLCDTGMVVFNVQSCQVAISNVATTDITDCGLTDGTIIITVSNGSGNYEYSIDSGLTWQSSATFNGLAAGNYPIAVKDLTNVCQTYGQTVTIDGKVAPTISTVNTTNPTDCGVSDGTIAIVASSAVNNGLEYSIDSGSTWQTSNLFIGLSGGTYGIRLRNNDESCVVADVNQVLMNKVAPVIDSINIANPTNCGVNNGTLTVHSVNSGIEFSIDGGLTWQSSSVFTGLSSGNYNLVIRNNDGTCEIQYASNPVIFTAPSAPSIVSVSNTNPTDCGVADGTITINATGGIGSYEYSIDSGSTWQVSNIFNGLTGGIYGIRARNADGSCMVSDVDITLTDKIAPTISSVSSTDPTDCGLINGTITISATNGNGSLEYSIDSGSTWQTSNIFIGLIGGVYGIRVRNADGSCVVGNTNEILTDKVFPTISSVVKTNPSNCGISDGTITVMASSSGSLEYSIDGGLTWQSSNSFTSLGFGTYNVKVRNLDGSCEILDVNNPVVLVAPSAPVVSSVLATDPTDCGTTDGTIVITATGGSGSYEYSIDSGTTWQISSTFINLSAGIYGVRVRNADGSCETSSADITLFAPTSPTISNVSSTNPTDCGVADGTITINATGGSGSYEYSIDNGTNWQISNLFIGLSGGIYGIQIRNANGSCEVNGSNETLNDKTPPSISNISSTNPSNCGVNDGSITIVASGSGTLEYSIDGGVNYQPSNTFTGLSSGNYNIAIRFNDGTCEVLGANNPTALIAPSAPSITSVSVNNPTDCGVNDGTILITVSGGMGVYEYSIDSGLTWSTSNSFTGLNGGVYGIRARNMDGSCEVSSPSLTLTEPQAPVIDIVTATQPSDCNISDGSIVINTVTIGNYLYSIDNGVTWLTNNSFTGLSGGNYTILVANIDTTCSVSYASNPIILVAPIAPTISMVSSTSPTDCNTNDGTITVTASGNGIIEYSIDGGDNWTTSNFFIGLGSGNYTIVIRNVDGSCEVFDSNNPITLTSPASPSITNTTFTNPTECGVSDGTISITVTGGTGSYEYSIDSGSTWQSSNTFTGLSGGIYQIRARNSNGTCMVSDANITLTDQVAPSFAAVNTTQPTNCGGNDATISIFPVITGTYRYSIDSGQTWAASNSGGLFTGLANGTYHIYMTNADSTCLVAYASNPVVITDPTAPTFTSVTFTNPTNCNTNDGTITINASGIGSLEYSIDGGLSWQSANTFNGLGSGNFNVAIRNGDGSCVTLDMNNPVTLTSPSAPSIVNTAFTDPSNCGLADGTITLTVSGGMGTYEHSIDSGLTWQSSNVFTGLSGGIYKIKVRNADVTCEVTGIDVTITDKIQPNFASVTSTHPTDCGEDDGSISILPTVSGILGYSVDGGVSWIGSSSGATFNNLTAGTYNLLIINNDSTCILPYSGNPVILTDPSSPIINNVIATNPTDCSLDNGTITINSTGGLTVEYSIDGGFTWQPTNVFTGLGSGNYNIAVRNSDATCEILDTANNPITLVSPSSPSITSTTFTNPSNCGISDGTILITVTGGSGSYEYSIDSGLTWQLSNAFTGLSGGIYGIRARNADGTCEVSDGDIVITDVQQPGFSSVTYAHPSDCGVNDGQITVLPTLSGIFGYSVDGGVNWIGSSSGAVFNNLPAGTYQVLTINPDSTCITPLDSVIVLNDPIAPTISNVVMTDVNTCNVNDGTITITATGTNTLEYSIDGGLTWQSSSNFNGLNAGNYDVLVRYINGSCAEAYINNPISISSPNAPTIASTAFTNPTDCGLSNGSITINASGGTGNLEYSIDSGSTWQSLNNFTGLAGGTYGIQVRNSDGSCEVMGLPLVVEDKIAPEFASVNVTDAQNCGVDDGTIIITTANLGFYQYSIDGGITWQSNNVFTGLAGGNYILAMKNSDNTCFTVYANNPVQVTAPIEPVITNVTTNHPTNCSVNDGSIVVTATGGASLEYSVDFGMTWQSNNVFTGLGSGNYNIVVRNADGTCNVFYTSNALALTSPTSPSITNTSYTDPSNCGLTDGTITITATSGMGSYEYSIDGGSSYQSSNSFTGLNGGNYQIRVRNADGTCEVSDADVVITDKVYPTFDHVISTNVTDCGGNDGTITISTNQTGIFGYSIDGGTTWIGSSSGGNFTGLSAGTYTLLMINNDSTCLVPYANNPLTITEPIAPTISNVASTNPNDCNTNNGTITITANGTSLEYSIDGSLTWQTSNTFTELSSGNYNIAVRNGDSSCVILDANNPVILIAPTAPSIASSTFTDPTDCGLTDGTILLSAVGGQGNYEYSIDSGSTWQTSGNYNGLTGGTYHTFVRNADGSCAVVGSPIVITNKVAPTVSTITTTDPTDCGLVDGSIVINASSTAMMGLEYSIDGGSNWQSTNIFLNLSGGIYSIQIRNSDGSCMVNGGSVTLTDKIPPMINTVSTLPNTLCGFNNGSVIISATGTSIEYSINGGLTWQNSNIFSNLGVGNYFAVIRNTDGSCEVPYANNPVAVISTAQTDTTYLTASTCNPAIAGTYIDIQTNQFGCDSIIFNTITLLPSDTTYTTSTTCDPNFVGTFVNTLQNVQGCDSVIIKTITLLPSDTTYTVSITCDANQAGWNTFVFSNVHGCDSVVIDSAIYELMTITNVSLAQMTDCNANDGSITINANTAVGVSLEYSIDSGLNYQTSNMFNNLGAGTYLPMIRNINTGCTDQSAEVIINTLTAPTIDSILVVDATDCNTPNGAISIFATGAMGLQYSIDSAQTWQTVSIFSNLGTGTYPVFIRNNNGTCAVGDTNIIINTPTSPIIDSISVNAITDCSSNDGQIIIHSPSTNIEYSIDGGVSWQASDTFTNLAAGNYFVFVRNNDGTCLIDYPFNPITLTNPTAPIIANVVSSDPTDCNLPDGTITISAISGSGSYLYSIDSGQTYLPTTTFNNLTGGDYYIFIANADTSCKVQGSVVNLVDKVAPTITQAPVSSPITDCGVQDGSIQIFATANSTLIFSIDSGATWNLSNLFQNLGGGNYNLQVAYADTTCRTDVAMMTLIAPIPPTIDNVLLTDVTNCALPNGQIEIQATANSPLVMEYSVDGGINYQSSNIFTNLTSNSYYVTVRYVTGGCEVSSANNPYQIGAPVGPTIVNVAHTDPSGCSLNDGSITISAIGGIAPLLYSIDSGATWTTNNIFSNLPPDTIAVYVANTDTSCFAIALPVIIDAFPTVVIDSITNIPPSNCAISDGQIDIHATILGNGTIEYSIDNGVIWQTSSNFSSLTGDTYEIIVRSGPTCEVNFGNYQLLPASNDMIDTIETIEPTSCGSVDGVIIVNTHPNLTGSLLFSNDNGVTWQTSNVFDNLYGGSYEVVVQALGGQYGCNDVQTTIVESADSGQITLLEIDDVSCYGGADGAYEVRLTLSNGEVIDAKNDLAAGTQIINLRDNFGCGQEIEITINQPDKLELLLIPQPIQQGQTTGGLQFYVTGGVGDYQYRVQRDGSINDTLIDVPFIYDLEAGTYQVTVIDSNDCEVSGTVELKDENLEVFNTITPNQDGVNDALLFERLIRNECTGGNSLIVFNRWGQIVFMTENYQNDWTGTDQTGALLPSGAYFYIFTCNDGSANPPAVEKRSLTILRE